MHNFEEETLSCKEVSSLQLVNLPLELLIQGVLREEGNVTWGGGGGGGGGNKLTVLLTKNFVYFFRHWFLTQGVPTYCREGWGLYMAVISSKFCVIQIEF